MKICLVWVNNNIDDKCLIGAGTFSEMFNWIYVLYALNNTMRSHTAGTTSMRYGIIHGKSSKQNINFKISTEAEPVEEVN